MKRFILVLLLALLPLQFVQAAICNYCDLTQISDSQSPASEKIKQTLAELEQQQNNGHESNDIDTCCMHGHCHLSSSALIYGSSPVLSMFKRNLAFIAEINAYQSFISRGLERPNWLLAI